MDAFKVRHKNLRIILTEYQINPLIGDLTVHIVTRRTEDHLVGTITGLRTREDLHTSQTTILTPTRVPLMVSHP